MTEFATSNLRSVVLVGHGGTGKTTLAEALLHGAGMTSRQGKVSDKNTVSDYDVEEKERQISIDLSVLYADTMGKRIYLLDAPGYADFFGAAISGLSAADTALIVVSAMNGVEVGTRKAVAQATKMGRPYAFVINKVDGEHVRIDEVLDSIRTVFGSRAIPINLPDTQGMGVSKVVSVLSPEGSAEYKNELFEAIVETDEELMEKYLGTGELTDEEFAKAFSAAMLQGSVFPVFFTSADKAIGTKELLSFVAQYFPSPADMPGRKGKDKDDNEIMLKYSQTGPFAGQVFRIQTDPFVGKLAYFRVVRGTVNAGATLYNSASNDTFKLAHLYRVQGKDQTEVESATAGEIVVVQRIDTLANSATICDNFNRFYFDPIPYPNPMVSLALEPKSRGDEQKISNAVNRAGEEDPTFRSERTASTNELVITGMGELHLDIILSRMKRRFDLDVVTRLPKIPFLETITGKADGHYRHKKQTGGAGQFGEVYIKVEPNERGQGLNFVDEIVGGVVPRQYIPAVEKGIREAMEQGILANYPVVDITVRLYDGKYHPVDSKEIAFKIAGRSAFQEAFLAAKPMLLEPIVKLSIYVPDRYLGDITGDLTSRRGRILGMDSFGDMQIINANVPLAEIQRYSTELRSTTQGEGYYEMTFSHYDVVPSNIASGIIAKAKAEREENAK